MSTDARRRRHAEQLVDERRLVRREALAYDEGAKTADPDTLVDEASELGVVGGTDARVVERDDLPRVVEDRRPRGAGLGVCLVVEEGVEHVHDPVLAQRDLLLLAARMLDDRDETTRGSIALVLVRPVEAELGKLVRRRPQGDEREVELLVREEEAAGIEVHRHGRQRLAVGSVLEAKLDATPFGDVGVRQDVVVRQQEGG